VTPNLGGIRC